MTYIIVFIIGALIGSILEFIINYHPEIGTLKINDSDGESYIFLALKNEPHKLKNGKRVILKIDTHE